MKELKRKRARHFALIVNDLCRLVGPAVSSQGNQSLLVAMPQLILDFWFLGFSLDVVVSFGVEFGNDKEKRKKCSAFLPAFRQYGEMR